MPYRLVLLLLALSVCVASSAWAEEATQPAKPKTKLASPEAIEKAQSIQSTDPLTDDPKDTPTGVITDKPVPIITQIADFIDATKQPTDWLSWGADLRMRELWRDNNKTLNDRAPGHEEHRQRYRFRLWTKIEFNESVSAKVRAVWEPRNYCKPDDKLDRRDGGGSWDEGEVVFDHMYLEFKDLFDLPLKLTVGRQDIKINDGCL